MVSTWTHSPNTQTHRGRAQPEIEGAPMLISDVETGLNRCTRQPACPTHLWTRQERLFHSSLLSTENTQELASMYL